MGVEVQLLSFVVVNDKIEVILRHRVVQLLLHVLVSDRDVPDLAVDLAQNPGHAVVEHLPVAFDL